jgi:hypothetical protein
MNEKNAEWRVNGSETGAPRVWVETAVGRRICNIPPSESDLDIARLIAAAPQLLEALKKARPFVVSSHDPSSTELEEINAAIVAAEQGATA